MIKYKLTTQDMTTHNGFQWTLGKKKTIEKKGTDLCSDQVFHFYDSPLVAVLMNPIHADIDNPRLFEVDCDPVVHDGTKGGSKWMKLIKELPVPVITDTQRVAFCVLCAKEVCTDPKWTAWADRWLSGEDRSAETADAATDAARAARAAGAAEAAEAAEAAARAAWAAWAAEAAARAAWAAWAAGATKEINLSEIAEKAMTYA